MVPLHFLRIALVSVFFFTTVNGDCSNPKVRKEWRKLTSDERTCWLNAVNVFLLPTKVLSFLAEHGDFSAFPNYRTIQVLRPPSILRFR